MSDKYHSSNIIVFNFQYVHEVVIGAPYDVTAELMDHFRVKVVCHGLTAIAPDANGVDPYKVPKQRGCFKVRWNYSMCM